MKLLLVIAALLVSSSVADDKLCQSRRLQLKLRNLEDDQCVDGNGGLSCHPGVACNSKWPSSIASLSSDLTEAHNECEKGDGNSEKGCGSNCDSRNCCLSNCFSYDRQYYFGECVDKDVNAPCPDVVCTLC